MLCDMKSNQLGRHIVTKHAMTTAEYKKRFPFAKVAQLSKKQLEKMISTKSLKASKIRHLYKKENCGNMFGNTTLESLNI
jgi:hypothetical protein